MAVKTLITSRKVYNQYANGGNIGSNLGTFFTFLRGGVMNNQKIVYTVELGWNEAWLGDSTGNYWAVNGNLLTRNQGSWIDEGFSIGDVIDVALGAPPTVVFADRTITNITDTEIYFDGAAVAATDSDIGGIINGGKTDLFGLEYSFGIINNDDEAFFQSLLDNSDQTYYADGIGEDNGGGRSTSFVDMQPKNQYNLGWDSSRAGQTRVRFVDRPDPYTQRFEIEHEYIINPYNEQSLLDENNSFKYVSKFDFRSRVSNINTSKVQIDDIQLGSVGYFDENYDGYNNDFSISNLVYTDVATLSTVTELNLKSKTRVSFRVSSLSGLFTTDDPFVCFHSYMPEFNDYDKSEDNFITTWSYKSNRNRIDSAPFDFNGIEQLEATFVDANNIDVSFEIEFTSDEQKRIEENDSYVLAIEVGDGDIVNQSKNVTLLIDENNYVSDNNITDLIISNEFGFAPYYKFIAPTADLFTTYFGWIEDEIVSYHRFGVNRSAAKDAEILGARFKIVAYEDSTGETFDLQNEQLDLSSQISAPSGTVNANPFTIQLIQDERTRGYRLPNGDEFNLLLFETDNNNGTHQFYEWRVGFKMNWQDWIALPNADNIFINTSDTFDGKNNRASNYSLKNGWSIRTIWNFDMQGLDDDGNVGETEYNFITQEHSIFDFDEQDDDPTTWDCEIFTFDEIGNNLGGAVLNDEPTFIKAIFTPQAPYVIGDILPYWGELRIAEENQPGFINDIISTTKPYLTDNKLIPLDGETFAKISLVSNTIEVEAQTNTNELKENVNYKLSARLANINEPPTPIQWVFKTEIDILNPADLSFDPSVTSTGGEVVTWELKEGSTYTTNSLNIPNGSVLIGDELNGVCQDVQVTFSTNDTLNIKSIDLNNDFICEDLDISLFPNANSIQLYNNDITSVSNPTSLVEVSSYDISNNNNLISVDVSMVNLSGSFQAQNCGNLEEIINPSNNNNITNYRAHNCNLQNLDISGLTGLGGRLWVYNNINQTNITMPNTNGLFINVWIFNNNLLSLDLSPLINLSGRVEFFGNSSLTSVTQSNSSASIIIYNCQNCNLLSLDLSSYSNLSGEIRAFSNPNMLSLNLPITTNSIRLIYGYNCDLGYIDFNNCPNSTNIDNVDYQFQNNNFSASEINQMLVVLDSVSVGGFLGREINFTGINAAPDGVSGGFDGLTAKSNLITKGFAIITN